MMKKLIRVITAAAILSLGVTANAGAATINLVANTANQEFDIEWLANPGVVLDALAEFSASVTNTFIDFTITMNNDSPLSGTQIHSFGFNIDPNATSVSNVVAGSNFSGVGLEVNLPSIDNNIDVCIFAPNDCPGGGQGGNLNGGSSDTISFRLNGNFTNGATLDTFGIKFQTAAGSFEFEGNPPGENPPPTSVPEPTSMLLVGLGLASVVGARRRG